jgi:hypothetical protein
LAHLFELRGSAVDPCLPFGKQSIDNAMLAERKSSGVIPEASFDAVRQCAFHLNMIRNG